MQTSAHKPNKIGKLLVTFLVTPAAPALVFCGFFALAYPPHLSRSNTLQDAILAIGLLFALAYSIAGAHVLVLGIPAFLLGSWLKAINWWTCIIVSFAIGGLPMAILGQ